MRSGRLVLGLWLGALLVTPNLFAQSRGLKKVQVGVPAISMGNIIIYFAKDAKIYEKYGLDVDAVAVAGSGIASKALISGSVLISPIATPTVMTAVLAGSDMVILAHTMPGVIQSLVVRPDIKRSEDLKGKTVGVTTFGSLTDFLVKYLARQKGLVPDKDFALLQIGTDSDRFLALQQGKIQGATLSHPNFIFAQRAGFHVLWDFFKEVDYPWSEIEMFQGDGTRVVRTDGTNLFWNGRTLRWVYGTPPFPTLNRLNFQLARLWPLKYAAQSFYLVVRKG